MNKSGRCCFCLVWMILLCTMLTGCSSAAEKAMNQAVKAMERGNYKTAIDQLDKVIRKADPEDPTDLEQMINAYYLRGDCHSKRGELEEAQTDYELALEADDPAQDAVTQPTATRYLRRALAAISIEDYEAAVEALQSGLALDDANCQRELLYNEVLCLEKTGDWNQAKVEAQRYTELYPEDEEMAKEKDFLLTR